MKERGTWFRLGAVLALALVLMSPRQVAAQQVEWQPTFAIGGKVSTLGLGAEAAIGLSDHAALRFGLHAFGLSRDFNREGIQYDGTLRLRSVVGTLDWFPFGGDFHVSPGLTLYNANQISAIPRVPAGQTFTLGGATLRSDPSDPVRGRWHLDLSRVGPVVLVGWGNMARSQRRLTFNVESGIVYHGRPEAGLELFGSACDVNTGFCQPTTSAPIQQLMRDEERRLSERASRYRVFPVFSVGVGYRF